MNTIDGTKRGRPALQAPMERLLFADEVATIIGMSAKFVLREAKAGHIRASNFGDRTTRNGGKDPSQRGYRFSQDAVREYIAAHTIRGKLDIRYQRGKPYNLKTT